MLNFTVSKPKTWFSRTELSEGYIPSTYMAVGTIFSYNYTLNGNESQTIPVEDNFHLTHNPEETKFFSEPNLDQWSAQHNHYRRM